MRLTLSDFDEPMLADVAERVERKLPDIQETERNIIEGNPTKGEEDLRKKQHKTRVEEKVARAAEEISVRPEDIKKLTQEALIGPSSDIVSVEFLEVGLLAKRSVGRISGIGIESFGTGFHVGLGLILTNNHVLPSEGSATGHTFQLNFEENKLGIPVTTCEYEFEPERFWLTDEEHDFTLVGVTDFTGQKPALDTFGWHVLIKEQGKILKGHPVNIIQHPRGRTKGIVVHNSHFLHLENRTQDDIYCWYSGDTEKGSSGSPVFNRFWEVVALHHMAVPKTNETGDVLGIDGNPISKEDAHANPALIAYVANEGIRASRVRAAIERAEFTAPSMKKIRDDLMALWDRRGARQIALGAAAKGTRSTVLA